MPGICLYSAERTVYTVNQGGTADRVVLYQYPFVLDRESVSVKGVFLFPVKVLATYTEGFRESVLPQDSFLLAKGKRRMYRGR